MYKQDANDEKCIKTSAINPPLEISLSDEEVRLLQVYHEKLHKIGIYLKIDNSSHLLRVFSVPSCLIHKDTGELRRSVSDTITILQVIILFYFLNKVYILFNLKFFCLQFEFFFITNYKMAYNIFIRVRYLHYARIYFYLIRKRS